MFTVGRRFLNAKAPAPCKQVVQDGIRATYEQWKDMNVDYAHRCDEAEIDGELPDHWGGHWKHMKYLAASASGQAMLRNAKIDVCQAEIQGRTKINKVIVSEGGKHRSVGMADLLRHCLINCQKCEVPPVVHMSIDSWQGLCKNCEDCDAARAGQGRACVYRDAREYYAKTTPNHAYT